MKSPLTQSPFNFAILPITYLSILPSHKDLNDNISNFNPSTSTFTVSNKMSLVVYRIPTILPWKQK